MLCSFQRGFMGGEAQRCAEDKAGQAEEELLTVCQGNMLFKGVVWGAGGRFPSVPISLGARNTRAFDTSTAALLGSLTPPPPPSLSLLAQGVLEGEGARGGVWQPHATSRTALG